MICKYKDTNLLIFPLQDKNSYQLGFLFSSEKMLKITDSIKLVNIFDKLK